MWGWHAQIITKHAQFQTYTLLSHKHKITPTIYLFYIVYIIHDQLTLISYVKSLWFLFVLRILSFVISNLQSCTDNLIQIIESTPHKNIITCRWGNDASSVQELSIQAVILPPPYWYSMKVTYNRLRNRTTPQFDMTGILSFAYSRVTKVPQSESWAKELPYTGNGFCKFLKP